MAAKENLDMLIKALDTASKLSPDSQGYTHIHSRLGHMFCFIARATALGFELAQRVNKS